VTSRYCCCKGFADQAANAIENMRSLEQLTESEKRFRKIFESLPNISVQGYDRNSGCDLLEQGVGKNVRITLVMRPSGAS
jgi:GAF domain-containing protein